MRKLKPKYKWTKRLLHFRILEIQRKRQEYFEERMLLAYETFGIEKEKHIRVCLGIAGVLEGKYWTEDEVKMMGINPKDVDFKELNEEISKVIN